MKRHQYITKLQSELIQEKKLIDLKLDEAIAKHCYLEKNTSCHTQNTITLVAHGSVVCTYMSRAKLFRNPLIDGPGTTFGWWHISHRGQNVQNGPTPFYGNCHYCWDCISRTIWDRKLTDPSKCAEWPYFGGSVIYLDT